MAGETSDLNDKIQFTWKMKVGFVLCSLALSLSVGYFLVNYFIATQGTEFESIKDLKRAMMSGGEVSDPAQNPNANKYESANLRGLITPHQRDDIIFDLIPNLNLTFQRAPVSINACGMRSPERPFAKDGRTFRIALLGDSFAFGWGVKQEESFGQVLEDNLNRAAAGSMKFEVLNFGVPGYSTFQEVAKFEELALDFNPDAVLVFFIENDFGLPFYVKDIYNPGSVLAASSFARLTWKAIDPKIEEQRLQMTAYDPNTALLRLSALCAKKNIPIYLAINPKKDWKDHKKGLTRALKNAPNIHLIEMRDQFINMVELNKIPEQELTLSFDPHPSALRHKMYGYLLTAPFMEYIQ